MMMLRVIGRVLLVHNNNDVAMCRRDLSSLMDA